MQPGLLRGLVIDRCAGCRGIWFERGELASVLDLATDLPAEPSAVGVGKRRCPACGVPTHVRQYRGDAPVSANFCAQCGGVFLDRGELGRIQAVAAACDAAFPEERAKRLAARSAQYAALADGRGVHEPAGAASAVERAAMGARIYGLMAATLGVAAGLAWLGPGHASLAVGLGLGIGAFVAARLLHHRRRSSPANLVLLFAFPGLAAAAVATITHGLWADAGRSAQVAAGLAGCGLASLAIVAGVTRREWDRGRGAGVALLGVGVGLGVLLTTLVGAPAAPGVRAMEFHMLGVLVPTAFAALFSVVAAFELPRATYTARLDEPVAMAAELWLRAATAFVTPFMAQGKQTMRQPSGMRQIVREVINPPPPERR